MMDKLYQSRNVKHQAIAHYLEFRELLDDQIIEMIRMEYGRVDSEFGPFSVKDYFKWINKSREFGDTIMIKLIASLWGVKITILRSDSLSEMRFRHDSELDDVDMVLVYNSKPVNGHYSPAICVEGGQAETLEIRQELARSKHYDAEVDRLERKSLGLWRWREGTNYKDLISSEDEENLDSRLRQTVSEGLDKREKRKGSGGGQECPEGSVIVDKKVLENLQKEVKELKKSTKVMKKIRKLLECEGGDDDDDNDNNGEPVEKRRKKGFKPAKDVQVVTAGAHVCTVCNEDKGTSTNLKRHIEKVHKHNYRYYCAECNKGFMLKSGYNQHIKTHEDQPKIKCTVTDCNSLFSSEKAMKKHLKLHGAKKHKKCTFQGCKYSTHAKDYLLQHIKTCNYNPNKVELFCDVCGQGGFYLPKKIAEHKRINHGW